MPWLSFGGGSFLGHRNSYIVAKLVSRDGVETFPKFELVYPQHPVFDSLLISNKRYTLNNKAFINLAHNDTPRGAQRIQAVDS